MSGSIKMKLLDLFEIFKMKKPENFDEYFDENGLDPNGISKEMVNHLYDVANAPTSKVMSWDELDEILGIE